MSEARNMCARKHDWDRCVYKLKKAVTALKASRIVIVDDDPIIRMDLRATLESAGYEIAGEARDGIEGVNLCETQRPDAVLMDIQMPLFNGLSAAQMINARGLCDCIIILTAYSMEEYVRTAADQGIMGYLVKPVSREMLIPAVEIALSRAASIRSLKKEVDGAKQVAKDRKLIERAKGILMKNERLTEDEAYKRLRKLAMDNRCPMAAIAEMLILNES